MKSYDYILSNRIGFGIAQVIPIIAMLLSEMTDGVQTIMVSLITPIVKTQWSLKGQQVSMITSFFYVGIIVGSFIAGKLADLKGRKKVIMTGSTIQIISSLLSAYSYSLVQFSIVRFVYGMGFGCTIVVSAPMLCEILPVKLRGRGMLILNFCAAVGKLIGVALAFIFIPDKKTGDWRLMLSLSAIPSCVVFVLVLIGVQESVRILLSQSRHQQAFKIINKMIKKNSPNSVELTDQQRMELLEWSSVSLTVNKESAGFHSLLTPKYLRITILIAISWFLANFNFFGQLFILPFIMEDDNSLASYAIAVLGEVPSVFLTSLLIEMPRFGRRGSLILFGILGGLIAGVTIFYQQDFAFSVSRFFMKCTIQMLYPYTAQLYETTNRSIGFGVCSGFGRAGSVVMPYILYPIVEHESQWLVFAIFSATSLLGFFIALIIRKDTTNRQLDQKLIPQSQPELITEQ